MKSERLIYLPLGGAGEIGMNMYVFGYGPRDRERFIVVDAGVTFPNPATLPGADVIIPDFSWLAERRDRIDACFLTHAHEDHVGALGYLCREIRMPVFARKFTLEVARRKLEELGVGTEILRLARPFPERGQVGPFSVAFLPISHSIPESSSLLLECEGGRILHTGDFKIDLDPVVGAAFDHDLTKSACGQGDLALFCDSTNIFSMNEGRSESSVGPELVKLFQNQTGAVAATTFASNIARVKQLADAGVASGRSVVLLGRAMNNMVSLALDTGMIEEFPHVIDPGQAKSIPRRNLLLLATGSQGEPRSATSQLSNGKFRGLRLVQGDTFLFSSKTIPGNELPVIRVINRLSQMGVRVIDDSVGTYHVSGHANRPDLDALYDLVKPEMVVPLHGEHRHLVAHVDHAKDRGIPSLLVQNGEMLDVGKRRILHGESIETSPLCLDGRELAPVRGGILRERLKMAREGVVAVSVVMHRKRGGLLHAKVKVQGIPGNSSSRCESLVTEAVKTAVASASSSCLSDDPDLESTIRGAARRAIQAEIGKAPAVSAIVHRI